MEQATREERRAAFGRALADAISATGRTQRSVGARLGVAQSAVSSWKAGAVEPPPQTVFALERALGLPPGHLSRHLGYLPVGEPARGTGVREAVLDDPLLGPVEKRGLLALYDTFVGAREQD